MERAATSSFTLPLQRERVKTIEFATARAQIVDDGGPGARVPSDPLRLAHAWVDRGHGVALATVVATTGSSPRSVGSQLVVDERGRFEGSVSAGCVENEVVSAAIGVIRTGVPRCLAFGTSSGGVFDTGLSCGGAMRILVEPVASGHTASGGRMDAVMLARAVTSRERGRAIAIVHDLVGGACTVFERIDTLIADPFPSSLLGDVSIALDGGGSTVVEERYFVQVIEPKPRLIIIGAVHIAQVLAPMAALADYAVTVVDPRSDYASDARFADVAIMHDWPDDAMAQLAPDRRTAVAAFSHDPKIDDAALTVALRSPAFYVGALGSRRSQQARLGRLRDAGLTEAELARLRGPIGLDIGARTPAEIAIATLAEIVAVGRAP